MKTELVFCYKLLQNLAQVNSKDVVIPLVFTYAITRSKKLSLDSHQFETQTSWLNEASQAKLNSIPLETRDGFSPNENVWNLSLTKVFKTDQLIITGSKNPK